MAYGAGDKPSAAPQKTGSRGDGADTKTVKVRAHTRRVRTGSRGDGAPPLKPVASPVAAELNRTARSRKPRPAPVSDVQSSGGDYGTRAADQFKSTADYHGAIKAAYNELSPRERRKRLSEAQARGRRGVSTPEDDVITKFHNERDAQIKRTDAAMAAARATGSRQAGLPGEYQYEANQQGAGRDVKSDADLSVADALSRREGFARSDALEKDRESKARQGAHKQAASDIYLTDPQKLKEAGFTKDKAETIAQLPGRVLPTAIAAGIQTLLAAKEDPLGVGGKTLQGAGESLASIPAGLVAAAHSPGKAIEGIAADYKRRYGKVLTDPKGFRERIKKEGAAPEVFDAAALASAGGATAGRALQGLAEAGRLGDTLEKVATVRPRLRVSGDTSVEQQIHGNLGENVLAAGRDAARAAVQGRRADRETASLEVRQAEANGEVTHIREGATKRAQGKMVAGTKGRRFAMMKAEGQREQAAASNNVRRKLNRPERRALKYAMQFGIHTPEAARTHLPEWIDRVERERAEHMRETGKTLPQNEIPDLKWLVAHADEAFTPRLAQVALEEGERAAKIGRLDPGVDAAGAVRRRHIAQAELLGEARPLTDKEAKVAVKEAEQGVKDASGADEVAGAEQRLKDARKVLREGGYDVHGNHVPASEFDADHLTRIAEHAREEGLAQPGYFPSEKRPSGVFAAFAAGGKKAVAGPKRYEGALLRTGRENANPEAHILNIQKGVKRKHNWNLVAEQFDDHAVGWSKNQTLNELKDELERRHIDPDTVAFWNPGKYRVARKAVDAAEGGGDVAIHDPTFESRHITDALDDSAIDHTKLDTASDEFKGTSGWSIIPREVYDEIHADVRPSSDVGRGYDIAKGKLSRVMLANPAWLQFQVASNSLMTGLAGVGPVDVVKAQRWWKTLSRDERDAIEPYIGVHTWYDEQRHLGASSNSKMVDAYRAFKTTGLYRRAHELNPFNALFRADNAQNNLFRKAVLYSRAKREAYRRMGVEGGRMMEAQARIADMLKVTEPGDAMRALLKDGPELEKHAKAVRDFLGDWTTYTAKERRVFSRSVMFYGFLRFSVKLAFYTMPVEHPLMASILLQMGRLQNDELHKLFGGDVPVWEIGNYFTDDGHKLSLTRLNPFFNALQYSGQGPGALVGSLGPLASITLNQLAGKNVAFDKLYTTHGSTQFITRAKDLSFSDRLRIGLNELLSVSPYYRMAERIELHDRQTSDSLLFSPRSTGSPGLGEKSHNTAQVLRETLAPLAGESGKESLAASQQINGNGPNDSTIPALPNIPAVPVLKLPPLPEVH